MSDILYEPVQYADTENRPFKVKVLPPITKEDMKNIVSGGYGYHYYSLRNRAEYNDRHVTVDCLPHPDHPIEVRILDQSMTVTEIATFLARLSEMFGPYAALPPSSSGIPVHAIED